MKKNKKGDDSFGDIMRYARYESSLFADMKENNLGIYIHIPFCIKKCNYCDFNSFASDSDAKKNYTDALCNEIINAGSVSNKYTVDTIFIGGGTPSILSESLTEKIMNCVRKSFKINDEAEISIEANPGTLTPDKIKAYKNMGINRISVGLQSTSDRELSVLGRIHNYDDFLKTYSLLREEGFKNINIDLMNGIPEQNYDSFILGLKKIKELNPEHISIYSLILEEGTKFYDMKLNLPSEEDERNMVHDICPILGTDYHQYEISNYSKEGFECRHNIKYWRRDEYLGFGLSAASLIENTRFKNTDCFEEYLKYFKEFKADTFISKDLGMRKEIYSEYEVLDINEQMSEYMILGLRMNKGISITDFENTFLKSIFDVFGDKIKVHSDEGLLEIGEGFVRLTDRGRDLANLVWADFLGD